MYYLDLLLAMTEKEIKARYKHAVFGFLWMVLNPVLQMLVIGFIFQYVTKISIENYFIFLFSGLLPWNFFTQTITKTTPIMVYERSLLQKAKFPREVIVLSVMLANTFHLLISLLLFLPIVGVIVGLQFEKALLLPVGILWIMVLTSGLSLFLTSLNIRFRDVNFFVQALLPLWFYATPILYKVSFLPESFQPIFYLNPMTGITEFFHLALLGQAITHIGAMGFSLLSSLVIFVLGVMVFKKQSPYFVDYI